MDPAIASNEQEAGEVKVRYRGPYYDNLAARQHYLRYKFDQDCVRIEQNDPSMTAFEIPRHGLNDEEHAIRLSRAMIGNTSLKRINLHLAALDFCSQPLLLFGLSCRACMTRLACQELAKGICQLHLDQLCLSGYAQNDEVRCILYQAIQKSRTIRGLCELKVFDWERYVHQLRYMLKVNIHLRSFSFVIPDSWTDDTAQQLSLGIRQSHLEEVEIVRQNRQSTRLGQPTMIRINRQTWTIVLKAVINSPTIKKLSVKGGANFLTAAVENMRDRSSSSSSQQQHQQQQGHSIVNDISSNNNNNLLSILELKNIEICNNFIEKFVQQCQQYRHLQELYLSGNKIGPFGAELLMAALTNGYFPAMIKLDLSNNKSMGCSGLKLVGEGLANVPLLELNLRDCCNALLSSSSSSPSSSSSLHTAEVKARNVSCNALLKGVQQNTHLHQLYVEGNSFPPLVVHQIEFCCGRNRYGYLLTQENNNNLATGLWPHVLAKVQGSSSSSSNNMGLVYYLLNEQPELVVLSCN